MFANAATLRPIELLCISKIHHREKLYELWVSNERRARAKGVATIWSRNRYRRMSAADACCSIFTVGADVAPASNSYVAQGCSEPFGPENLRNKHSHLVPIFIVLNVYFVMSQYVVPSDKIVDPNLLSVSTCDVPGYTPSISSVVG